MRISVVMAAYNADPYLVDAINSVLDQTRPPDEFIVVADRPTATTLEILAGFGNRIVSTTHPEPGAARALNKGIALSNGDHLAFQDADDLWLPDKLERQIVALGQSSSCEAVFGHVRQFVSPEIPDQRKAELAPPNEIVPGVSKITLLITRQAFMRIGMYDETMKISEFMDWYSRAQISGLKSVMLPEVLALRRLHESNIGRSQQSQRNTEYLGSLKALVDARRRGTPRTS